MFFKTFIQFIMILLVSKTDVHMYCSIF